MSRGAPAGTTELVKLASRRDRLLLAVWADALIGSSFSTAYSLKDLFPDAESRRTFVAGIRGASGAAPLYGAVNGTSLGALTAWRLGVVAAVAAAVMSVMLVVRHTRADEQTGRQELVAAGVVDRTAPLVAALQLAVTMDLTVGVGIGAVLPILGLPVAGAFALGLAVAGCGIVFAGVAAVTAQVFESARTATGSALALLAFFFLLRAVGDTDDSLTWVRWLSPIGWAQQVRPYAGDRWWVLALPAAAAAALVSAALRLLERRDYGAGLVAARPGPARAGAATRGAFGLAWRLHRGTVLSWTGGVLAGALVTGSFVKNVDVLAGGASVRKLMTELGGTQDLQNAYLAALMGTFGIMAAALVLSVLTRARAEEADGRIELVFSGTVGRARWVTSHVVVAAGGATAVLAAAGLGTGLSYGLSAHRLGHGLGSMLGAAFAQLPAVLAVGAVAVLLLAAFPRLTAVSWGLYGVFAFVTLVGPSLKAGHYLMDVSPFSQVPKLPGAPFEATPLVVMGALALVGLGVSLAAFRRRDLLA
ncbi:ABC transporter permease [Streptomyces sp. NPDC021020]|uniref:ABC transporter permease n=1 Tax=Streptomyces sp. NPDC021020 TaxID=3365109 RepID=UPI0037917D1B